MKVSVLGHFRKFSERFEGCVPYMYLDIKGLVTVGIGNLIDPVEEALKLPFRFKDNGEKASVPDISREWKYINGLSYLKTAGAGAAAFRTTLELSDEDIGKIVKSRLLHNDIVVSSLPAFYKWDSWPADAQLGVMSMAWAMGAGGFKGFPKFMMAAANSDFAGMAAECKLDDSDNAGLTPRNAANKQCFLNAAQVVAQGLDPEVLHYPDVVKGNG